MKNILVCVDFERSTPLLLNKAAEMANALSAKIWLLHAAAPDPDFVGYGVGPQYIRDSRADTLKGEHLQLSQFVENLLARGIDTDGLLVQGPTIEVILEESKKLKADLIMLGHHDHSFIYRLFTEVHATQLVRKSEIPLFIVPLPD